MSARTNHALSISESKVLVGFCFFCIVGFGVCPQSVFCGTVTLTNADVTVLRSVLQAGGTINLSFDAVLHLTGPLMVTTDTAINGSGHSVTFDGGCLTRHFVVSSNATLRLEFVSLINGSVTGVVGVNGEAGAPGLGGSIYSSGGIIDLNNCRFLNNFAIGGSSEISVDRSISGGAGYGGVIYLENGRARIWNCVFDSNGAAGGEGAFNPTFGIAPVGDAAGGAIYSAHSSFLLLGVTLVNNRADNRALTDSSMGRANGETRGGALAFVESELGATNCVLRGNQVFGGRGSDGYGALGGAFHSADSTAIIHGSVFESNTALGGDGIGIAGTMGIAYGWARGGAVYQTANGKLEFQDCTFSGNRAIGASAPPGCCDPLFSSPTAGSAEGGAIYSDTDASMVNCTLAENSANGGSVDKLGQGGSARGGAINGHAALRNVTIARNSVYAGEPSAGALGASIYGASSMINTILHCLPGQTNAWASILDGGHNISSDVSANFTSPTSRGNLDPLLGSLADNGGPTQTLPLLPNSPAIDAGDNAACPPTDQRGVNRPMGLACDIGAFELAPTVTLKPAAQNKVSVLYHFKAGETNDVSNSTSLTNWQAIGTRVSDSEGTAELEQVDPAQVPTLFYKVAPR